MRNDSLRLEDIREAIVRIEKYAAKGREAFDQEELVQVWILHHLEIVGEACRGFSMAFLALHPDPIWSDAIGFRNVLAHQYFGLDYDAVWAVVEKDLPVLKQEVEEILAEGKTS
jgi:uncharacterized protein with HEPN domain